MIINYLQEQRSANLTEIVQHMKTLGELKAGPNRSRVSKILWKSVATEVLKCPSARKDRPLIYFFKGPASHNEIRFALVRREDFLGYPDKYVDGDYLTRKKAGSWRDVANQEVEILQNVQEEHESDGD